MHLAKVIPREEIHLYKMAFDGFDMRHTGQVNKEYLEPLLRSLGFNPMQTEIEDMKLDMGKSQTFDFDSFMLIVSRHSRATDTQMELTDIFRALDKNNSGRIPADFAKKILQNTLNPLNDEEVHEVFQKLTVDEDGTVEYKELVEAMLGF